MQAMIMVKKFQRMGYGTCNDGIKYSRLRDKFYVPFRLGAIACF